MRLSRLPLPLSVVAAAALAVALAVSGCARQEPEAVPSAAGPGLAGAWRSSLQFKSGAFAAVHDLEFMYVFHDDGTMTESSNYDAAPPVPPAYGVWRRLGPNDFEAKYEYFATKSPSRFEEIAGGGGWLPAGRGVLTERITLSADGKSFASRIQYVALDAEGKPVTGGGDADGRGERIDF